MVTLAAHLIRLISLTTLSPVSGSFQSNFPFLLMRGGSTSLSRKNVSTITVSSRRISTSQEGLSLAFFLTGRGSETVWRSSIVLFVAELRRDCGEVPCRGRELTVRPPDAPRLHRPGRGGLVVLCIIINYAREGNEIHKCRPAARPPPARHSKKNMQTPTRLLLRVCIAYLLA